MDNETGMVLDTVIMVIHGHTASFVSAVVIFSSSGKGINS